MVQSGWPCGQLWGVLLPLTRWDWCLPDFLTMLPVWLLRHSGTVFRGLCLIYLVHWNTLLVSELKFLHLPQKVSYDISTLLFCLGSLRFIVIFALLQYKILPQFLNYHRKNIILKEKSFLKIVDLFSSCWFWFIVLFWLKFLLLH